MYLLPEGFEKRLLASMGFFEEEIEPSIPPPIKSEHQRNLEERGWELVAKVKAKNPFMDYTENRESFRLLKKDCERFYPEKRIKLARAHDRYGKRIPSEEKTVFVYARDKV